MSAAGQTSGERQSRRGSLSRGLWMSIPNITVIHPVSVEVFQFASQGTCRVGDVLFFKDENKMRRTNHRRVCLKPKTSTLLVSDPPLTPRHKASPLAPLDWNHNTRAFRCMKEHKMKTEALAPLSLDLSLPLSGPPSHRFSLPPSLIVLVITPPVYDCDLIWANPDHWNYKSDIYF